MQSLNTLIKNDIFSYLMTLKTNIEISVKYIETDLPNTTISESTANSLNDIFTNEAFYINKLIEKNYISVYNEKTLSFKIKMKFLCNQGLDQLPKNNSLECTKFINLQHLNNLDTIFILNSIENKVYPYNFTTSDKISQLINNLLEIIPQINYLVDLYNKITDTY